MLQAENRLTVNVVDHGGIPIPVTLRIDFTDGTSKPVTRPASVWFSGTRSATLAMLFDNESIARVTLDPEYRFQDVDRTNNVWNALK